MFNIGQVNWCYSGDNRPSYWGDLSSDYAMCKSEKIQSPIDIPSSKANQVSELIKANYKASKAEVINNGHTIQVSLGDGG